MINYVINIKTKLELLDCVTQRGRWERVKGSHPIQVDNDKKMNSCLEYIHYNPVNAGFVQKPEYWRYKKYYQ